MAVKIKLQRLGKIREPFYRVIVADARTRRDGRAIETIGKYDPTRHPSLIEVNSERAQHWLDVGAQPTEPVMAILKVTGDWQKHKGLPGAEGTLQQPEQKPSKQELFNAALAQAGEEPSAEATTPKKKGGGRKSSAASESKASDEKAAEGKAADEKPAEGKAADNNAAEDKAAENKAAENKAESGKQEQA